MPRHPDPENEAHRRRQERYRERLDRPESWEVDKAVADAVAAYGLAASKQGLSADVIERIKGIAVNLLTKPDNRAERPRIYDREAAEFTVDRRLSRLEILAITKRAGLSMKRREPAASAE